MKPLAAASLLSLFVAGAAEAQVFVRAPFVRVAVGGPGVHVRAPFVNLFIPSRPRYYAAPVMPAPTFYAPRYYGPGTFGSGVVTPRYYGSGYTLPPIQPRYVPAAPRDPIVSGFVPPAPKLVEPSEVPRMPEVPEEEVPDTEPRPATGKIDVMTVDEFVKTFKPRAGSYEIDLLNPVTKTPTNVRFTLPEGMLMSVQYRGNTVEFNYGRLRFVRIEFDKDGALVTSR